MAKSKKNLIIIESPTKAHTIQECLGSNYRVIASKGHVRDLPKSSLGIDIENGFAPHYINIRGKGDTIKELRKEAKKASKVFLATDPDREGEAISWHLAYVLGIDPDKALRVTFNELTKNVIKTSVKNPRGIDMNLVNAQQSRRILDRIVGYKLSPLLWKKVGNGLSAGRVQSVATRLVVERETEIRKFVPEEYWTVSAVLDSGEEKIRVRYVGGAEGDERMSDGSTAKAVAEAVNGKKMTVKSVRHAVKEKNPAPPFTTSTMQQEASRKLGFRSARIMSVAQELYEGINLGPQFGGTQGLITYMRTDSLRVSSEASDAAREFISRRYGEEYRPEQTRVWRTKAGAQDAHEAIRPARVELVPADVRKFLTPDQYKLYNLIWARFVASQMSSARLDTVKVDFESGDYGFRTGGYTVSFPGYMALYEESADVPEEEGAENIRNFTLPAISEGQLLDCEGAAAEQHFTEPPARYTEASIIKELEEKGIGRPSTITPTITTITARKYVSRDGKALVPTELGEITTNLMKEDFSDIVDYGFTAGMEEKLDDIENGTGSMQDTLREFWEGFSRELDAAEKKENSEKAKIVEQTDIICDKCGARMVIRTNRRNVRFAACPNYPQCRNTKSLDGEGNVEPKPVPVPAGFKCELCGSEMVERTGPYGKFYACSNFPACRNIKNEEKAIDVPCPKCGGRILIRNGKRKNVFYSCENYPDCDFSSWDLPVNEKCPECGSILFRKKGKTPGIVCRNRDCGYFRPDPGESAKTDSDE